MNTIITLIALMLIIPSHLFARQDNTAGKNEGRRAALPQAVPMLSPAVCGKGTYLFSLGNTSVGRETFEIKCTPDGYMARGRTELKLPGASIDLDTTLESDKSGFPIESTAIGTINNAPFEQTLVIKDGYIGMTGGGKSQQVQAEKGTMLLGSNVFYMFQFILGRYSPADGGVQHIPSFPNISVRIERVARDEAQPSSLVAGGQKTAFDRYTVTLGLASYVVWVDMRGRLAVLMIPAQRFSAVLEEYKGYAQGLNAALASTAKAGEIDYSAPPDASFTAEEVTVQAKGFTLAGTLLLPKTGNRPFPAVITITGSGQQTRDEALPIPGLEKYRPFRQVAEFLAARGMAVLRVDDRGVGKSAGADTLKNASSFDFADDVRAQVDYLRKRGDIDPNRIALVGHSEGGIIAPIVASSDSKIAAIVLMAGTAKSGMEVVADQMRDVLERDPTLTKDERAKRMAEQQTALQAILEDRDAPNVPAQLRGAWMKVFLKYDPLQTIGKVRQPILILQGALDRQVTAEQAAMLEKAARKAGNRAVTTRVYPKLNHLFLPSITGAFSEYTALSTSSVPDEVLNDLGKWLQQKLGVK